MGWSGGSSLGEEMYMTVRRYIPEKSRKRVANKFYDLLCDMDADDWDGTSQIEKDGNINQNLDEE